jgi:hypothetical protein
MKRNRFSVPIVSGRSDLSAGERAMAMAMLYPEADKRGRGNKGKAAESADFSQRRLREARQVLRYSRELAKKFVMGR